MIFNYLQLAEKLCLFFAFPSPNRSEQNNVVNVFPSIFKHDEMRYVRISIDINYAFTSLQMENLKYLFRCKWFPLFCWRTNVFTQFSIFLSSQNNFGRIMDTYSD